MCPVNLIGVMIRLVFVLAPAASILAGVGTGSLILGTIRHLLLWRNKRGFQPSRKVGCYSSLM